MVCLTGKPKPSMAKLCLTCPDPVYHSNRDFDHPRPTARDISAGMSASCGLLKIYQYLRNSGKVTEGRNYLQRGIKLVQDMMKLSLTPLAPDVPGKEEEFGEEGWETIFKVCQICRVHYMEKHH
jgi:hypothetical protein